MDYLFNDRCTSEELQRARELYEAQAEKGKPSVEARFGYAVTLIRSNDDNVKLGIAILEDLLRNDEDDIAKRDYLYYLAVGWCKRKDYDQSLKYIDALLRAEPSNMQARDLKESVHKRMKKDGLIGAAMIGGAFLAGGAALVGIIAAGVAASRK
jgi:fission 1 protein